jgi:3-oxoacyl-[acyl-carrier protein] reductase
MAQMLANKVAFITGGSRGIGAGIARRLANEGAIVVITYVSSPQKAKEVVSSIESKGGQALAILADASDPEATKLAIAETVSAFGRIDILVNNAGTVLRGNVADFPIADFESIVGLNVRSVYIATQEAAKHMSPGGRVINIGSMVADKTGFSGTAFYSMTKAAVAAMTRGFAIDLAPRGITVNNIQPGPTETDLNPADGQYAEQLKAMIPLHRFGTPDEIGAFAAFLAGPDASFITGASLTIDGGLTA